MTSDIPSIEPLIEPLGWKAFTLVLGYVAVLSLSGVLIRRVIGRAPEPPSPTLLDDGQGDARHESAALDRPNDVHAVIGKCENILTVTFVLADALTGLALIFAAKSLVRAQDIHRDPGYYLGGTLVNLVWSVLVGFAIKILIIGGP